MHYRKATADDIERLIALRATQLVDEGLGPARDISAELREFFKRHMDAGTLIEWVVEDEGEIVATAAIMLFDFLPTFSNPGGTRAYVTNMYTRPSHRGHGLATSLLSRLREEAASAGIKKMFLGASRMGKSVYAKFGFLQSDKWMEMDI